MKRVEHEDSYHAIILGSRLRAGAMLCVQSDSSKEGKTNGGVMFWLSDTGRKCSPKAALELINKAKVEPLNDGLFDGHTQSYKWVDGQ